MTHEHHGVVTAPANYIVFSDVHLGADLVQKSRPWTLARLKRAARIDRDLGSMIDHYRAQRDPERPWHLVIAGDLIDFIGISIAPMPDTSIETALTDEEQEHGLGSAPDHALLKMRAVARRHALVFEKLAAFVADGHSLVLVRGNHDIDFHWESARRAFVDALVERVPTLGDDPVARAEFEARIEFCPWFYYVEGLLYVEHGHQYDAACSYEHLLAPVSPRDPKRIRRSFADILLRRIVQPTRGMSSEGHETTGALYYVRLALSLGVVGAFRLAVRFARAIADLVGAWREEWMEHVTRAEHERRLEDLAQRAKLKVDKLRSLAALTARPVTRELLGIVRSLFLERLAFAVVAFFAVSFLGLFGASWHLWVVSAVVAAAVWRGLEVWSIRTRAIDPRESLHRVAERIAALIPTRFVVMGHTHEPKVAPIRDGATYVNLGGWAVDDLDDEHAQREAPRTHLVIRLVDGQLRAELRAWHPDEGLRHVHAIGA